MASVTAPNNETIAFTYDAGGRLVEQRLNSGQRTTQTWFEDGGLKQKQNLYNTTVLSSHLYSLDQQGRRAGQTETINASTKTWSYLYDNLDRLTEANDGTAETYSYDIYGNRRTKTKSGTTTAYLYDAAHQLSEVRSGSDTGTLIGAAVHDADGHMVKLCESGTVTRTATDCTATGTGATTLALVWNALDHLQTATRTGTGAVTESYVYDDSGRRISKTSAGATTSYLYDGDAIHAEWNGSISGNPAAAYVHGAGIDEPLLRLAVKEEAQGWLSGAVDSARQRLTDFASGVNVGGTLDQFGRKLAYDFVQNNQGTFGAYGWMADQLAPYAQGYDGSSPNGQLAAAAVFGATLATPGGGISKAKNAANGAEVIGTVEGRAIRSGDFSIVDWSGYPAGVPKPSGPVNLVPRAEYQGARSAANAENRAIHRADPSISPQQIHEVQPIRFGGSPTDAGNKVYLDRSQHQEVTNWWNDLQRYIQGLGQ